MAHLSNTVPGLVVIGCGNLNRSDDGVGVCVLRQLRKTWGLALPADVRLFDAGTGGMEVMFMARGARAMLIIDASRSGAEPGAVFQLPGSEICGTYEPGHSLHDFRWDHAVHAGRRIFGSNFPADVTVFLVEAGSLALGTDLTPPVQQAVAKVCALIDQRLRDWAAAGPPA